MNNRIDVSEACPEPRRGLHLRGDLGMIAALVVSVSSAITLAAFDKPLDRAQLTPSVLEVMGEDSAIKPAGTEPQPKAHAMLLRYEFRAPVGATWHSGAPESGMPGGLRAQPLLL